jgi:serine protease inhibitor
MENLALFEAQADFAVNLLRENAANMNDSLIMSPISIALALSLAYVGAVGQTRSQFDSVFAKGIFCMTIENVLFRTIEQCFE